MDKIETFEVQAATPERLYSKMYHDFIDCTLLNGDEKLIYMVLKRFMDFRYDSGEAFPSIETLCRLTEKTRPTITKTIKSLQKKGVIEVVRRGLNKSNLYKLADHPNMWAAGDLNELKIAAQESEIDRSIRILQKAGYFVTKKEELASVPTKASETSPSKYSFKVNNITSELKSQYNGQAPISEPYPLAIVRRIFDYDLMVFDHPMSEKLIDAAMGVLYTALNATGPFIRVAGQERPADAVKAKLLKLTNIEIIYTLKKFEECTADIKNVNNYLLTMLYLAPEQMQLNVTNQLARDQAEGWGQPTDAGRQEPDR